MDQKKTYLILALGFLTSFQLCLAQNEKRFFHKGYVECYIERDPIIPVILYDSLNGNVVDSLKNYGKGDCWFKLAILDASNGWAQLEDIVSTPDCRDHPVNDCFDCHRGKWIKTDQLRIGTTYIPESGSPSIKFYSAPTKESEIIYRLRKRKVLRLVETSDRWVKVEFDQGDDLIEGWLKQEDQCAYPWTVCPSTP